MSGDLFWYPVEGEPGIRQAPDIMVVFGRPRVDRGSYRQWLEAHIAPQVTFEIWSPGNRPITASIPRTISARRCSQSATDFTACVCPAWS